MAGSDVKFFKGRREVEIGDFHSLRSRGDERRVKASVRVPLSNRSSKGTPEWVLDGFLFVVKDESLYNKTACKGARLEGMSVEFFTTNEVKRRMLALNSCTMDRFSVERVGEDEKAIVYLNFVLYAPCTKDTIGWFYDYQGKTVFAEFDATQASLAYGGETEEEEEEEVPGDLVGVTDPNDDPKAPIPGDTRKVTLPSDPPAKRSHKKKE